MTNVIPRTRPLPPHRAARRGIAALPIPHSSFSIHRFPKHRRGVGLAELLVALAISAAVLTATAVAIDASFKAYQVNQEFSDLTQRSRMTIARITAMIRQTQLHAPHTASIASNFAVGQTVTDTGIDMFDLAGNQVAYTYDVPNQRILATVNGVSHTLIEGVTSFTIGMEPMRSANSIKTGGAWDLLRRASITLTVKSTSRTAAKGEAVGKETMTLSASVMPRRNTW